MSATSTAASSSSPLTRADRSGSTAFDTVKRLGVPALVLALAALVILLALENRRLERALVIASERSAGGLTMGDLLPAFDIVPVAATPANASATIGATADASVAATPAVPTDLALASGELRNALLFFFTTTCKVCKDNHEAWARLAEEHASSRIVLGIGLDDPAAVRAYAAEHELPYEVAAARDNYLGESLGLPGVPMTIAIDGTGRVQARELGVLPAGWTIDG